MSKLFPNLCSEHTLRHLTLKNRINFGAHSANMSVNGELGKRGHEYYVERARGGAAMICMEPMAAHQVAVNTRGQYNLAGEEMIGQFKKLGEEVHSYGCAIVQQVFHQGPHVNSENSQREAWSPSGNLSYSQNAASHAMTEAEIEVTIQAFINAALVAQRCGFDGVEINGGYDSLIPTFWTPAKNRRDDRWGGSFENRMRFSVEVLSRVRKAVGENFIVGLTFTGVDRDPGGLDAAARQEIAEYHDRRGLMDYVAIKTGHFLDFQRIMPTFVFEGMVGAETAAGVKDVLKYAQVQAEGKIRTPANGESLIAAGQADMISFVRGQIADPFMARKATEDRPQEIRGCLSCNQVCWNRRVRDTWISCLVNPSVGREFEWGSEDYAQVETKKRIVVVGAGPAGLEVSRVCAARGHDVILIDKNDRVGGQFRLAATQPSRGDIAQLLNWYYLSQITNLGVDLRLNTWATPEMIRSLDADEVVYATGSEPTMNGFQRALPNIAQLPGVDNDNVFSINDVLTGDQSVGQRVLVLDDLGGWPPASGTVAFLGKRGHDVTVLYSEQNEMSALTVTTADVGMRKLWDEANVQTLADSVLLEWTGSQAKFRNLLTSEVQTLEFDSLVLATANKPVQPELDQSPQKTYGTHFVGDCVSVRTAAMAIKDGRDLGLRL